MSCDPNTLSIASRCFNCFDPGKKWDVLIYILTQAAGLTTNPQTLSVVSRCMECIPDGRKLDVINYLTAQISNSSTNAEGLALASKCFRCIPDGNKLNAVLYSFAQVGHVSTEPGPLATASKCFACISDGHKIDVVIYLLTQIAHSSTDPAVLMGLSNGLQAMSDGVKWDVWIYLACASGAAPPAPTPVLASSVVRYIGNNYSSVAGTLTLPDSIGGFNMIQTNIATPPTKVALGDGNSYVQFTNNDFSRLACVTFPSVPQPFTLSFLWRWNSHVNAARLIGTDNSIYVEDAGSAVEFVTGSFFSGTVVWSFGTWFVTTMIFNTGSSSVVNNDNVPYSMSGSVTNVSLGGGSSTYLGGKDEFVNKLPFDLLELNIYSAALNAATITTLYNYYKTTYPGALLP